MSKETLNEIQNIKAINNEEKQNLKETIYDKIDIPLHKLDKFIIFMIILTIFITIFVTIGK